MLKRLYIHNFGCLLNFELRLTEINSCLLIGTNGSGKSTVGKVLWLLTQIAKGNDRVSTLIKPESTFLSRTDGPIRFELELTLDRKEYHYSLALELPEGCSELRVAEETLLVAGSPVFDRKRAHIWVGQSRSESESAAFELDWYQSALSVIQPRDKDDPLQIFRNLISRTLILEPIPSLMTGASDGEALSQRHDLRDFGRWVSGILGQFPGAYITIVQFIKTVIPSFEGFQNDPVGPKARALTVNFSSDGERFSLPFENLSDGEKCFFACAFVLVANEYYGPLICYWDEPENYLSASEVGYIVRELRHSFENKGQLLLTSHNPESINQFSHHNTYCLHRKSRLEPTIVRTLDNFDTDFNGDFISAFVRGDVAQ